MRSMPKGQECCYHHHHHHHHHLLLLLLLLLLFLLLLLLLLLTSRKNVPQGLLTLLVPKASADLFFQSMSRKILT